MSRKVSISLFFRFRRALKFNEIFHMIFFDVGAILEAFGGSFWMFLGSNSMKKQVSILREFSVTFLSLFYIFSSEVETRGK